jgi:phage terminase large subunit-like protein
MAQIAFNLHPPQAEIHGHPARFKIVAAGRRFGKTVFAVIRCFEEALASHSCMGVPLDSSSEVIYIGIDREQAKRNAWPYFKKFATEIEKATGLECRMLEKTSMIELPPELGGCRIRLLGMDDPDAARGMKLRYAVLDEYADMPSRVWPEIIRPALADVRGGALFIGTPKGRNHFYDLVQKGITELKAAEEAGVTPTWVVFNFATDDNPFIHVEEREDLIKEYTNGSEDLYAQEIQASFISQSGQLFRRDQFEIVDSVPNDPVQTFVSVDLAGFETDPNRKSQIRKLDDSAIAIVSVNQQGHWLVKDIQYGKWGPRECALRMLRSAKEHKAFIIGIERGALKNAVEPYLNEYMAQMRRYIEVVPTTHGNQRKYDRIQWALQGRAQKGQIKLLRGDWNEKFLDQAVAFPDRNVHDDLVDALAYVDQLAPETIAFDWAAHQQLEQQYEPLDSIAGY